MRAWPPRCPRRPSRSSAAAACPRPPRRIPAILTVPYLPQTEALCGGASAAMVMRYWGARDVYPDAFAPLVDRSAGGIHTSALVSALEARRWTAVAGPGDAARWRSRSRAAVRSSPSSKIAPDGFTTSSSCRRQRPDRVCTIRRGRRRGGRRHDIRCDVAEVAALDADPAAAAGGSHAAAARPDPGRPMRDATRRRSTEPCAGRGRATGSALAESRRESRRAARAGRPRRRRARGRRRRGASWPGSTRSRRSGTRRRNTRARAVALDPADAHAWRILATAEYVQSRRSRGARRMEPHRRAASRISSTSRGSSTRATWSSPTRSASAPRELLTPDALRLARAARARGARDRRSRASPFIRRESGRAQIDVSVVERDRGPTTYASWLGIGSARRPTGELAASFANVSGGGDSAAVAWRWWAHRPMIAASYAAPAPRAAAALATRCLPRDADLRRRGLRRNAHARGRVADGQQLDRLSETGIGDGGDRRSRGGRSAAHRGPVGRVEFWPVIDRAGARGRRGRLARRGRIVRGRSTPRSRCALRRRVRGHGLARRRRRIARSTQSSPASIWPGADTGHARDVLLRAHPAARRRNHQRRRLRPAPRVRQRRGPAWRIAATKCPVRLAPAAFVDIARASRGLGDNDPIARRSMRVPACGCRCSGIGVLRIDVAHGLRDGRTAFSVGWMSR